MNTSRLVRHVMWVDVQAQRRLLVVWGLVLLVQVVLFAIGPEDFGKDTSRYSRDLGILLVRFGWTIILTAVVVQSDLLVGTTAFWMTRPIPRGVLLVSKMLWLMLWLVVLPIAVMTAVLLWLGMRPLDALAGGGAIGLEQAVILVMAIMAALVTANIGQFVVAGIAGVTVVSLFNALFLPVLTLAWPSVGDIVHGGGPTVYAIVVIAGGLAAITYHYLTLRAWHTVVLITCAMLLATALTRLWPAPPVVPDIGPIPESVMATAAVSLKAASPTPKIDDTAAFSEGKRSISKRLEIETTSTGHPPSIYFWPVIVSTDIRYPTLAPIRWSGLSDVTQGVSVQRDRDEGQPWRSIRVALGDVDLVTPRGRSDFWSIADVPEAEFHAHSFLPGQVKADFTMVAYRYELTAVVPLKAGVSYSVADGAARILSVASFRTPGMHPAARIELRVTALKTGPATNSAGYGWPYYVLRNNERRQAVLVEWADIRTFFGTIGISATSVATTQRVLGVQIPPQLEQRFGIDAAWLNGAELVLLEAKPLGVLTRTLTIDNFVFGAPPESRIPSPEPRVGTVR